MAMSEGLFDPVFTFLSPLMANAAASKGIEEKFGPMVAKILNSKTCLAI
jgi:hypothetical protein